MSSHYDVLIIGAGMSGLAAGIRLAHFGHRVAILEQHTLVGGLNSYYRRHGHEFEVGLHAVTNYAERAERRAPLNRLLRQLRISRDDLDMRPQQRSCIRFPEMALHFTNDLAVLEAEVDRLFPDETDRFRQFVQRVLAEDCYALDARPSPTRPILEDFIPDPLLREMILTPVMFYGNPMEEDMDFVQFCLLFRSIFLEGLWRPAGGIRRLIELLVDRYRGAGGELHLGTAVERLEVEGSRIARAVCGDGEVIEADAVLSTAGGLETLRLCDPEPAEVSDWPPGMLSFVETVLILDRPLHELGLADTIRFDNATNELRFARATEAVDYGSRVLCMPGNFDGVGPDEPAPAVRITRLANHEDWFRMDAQAYQDAKDNLLERELAALEAEVPSIREHVVCTDMFTPCTVNRFAGHIHGAVYGSPRKQRDGATPFKNLFLAGTDQGFLGVVGALLSGVSITNARLLQ